MLNQKWSSTKGQINSAIKRQKQEVVVKFTESNGTELHSVFKYLDLDSMSFNTTEYISLFNMFDNNQVNDYHEFIFKKKSKRKKKIK